MSPTYWTASQIKTAARENGWEFIPCVDGVGPWGARKDRYKVMFEENRVGGLTSVWFTYPMSGGSNCDYLGPRYRGKLGEVLAFPERVFDGFGNPVMQQRWWFVPGTINFMEEQFRDCITPEPKEAS